MAGAFCLVLPADRPDGSAVARRLAAAMRLFPWQDVRLVEVRPGRVWLGAVVNSGGSDALAASCHIAGPVAAVVEGWLLRSRVACGAEPLIAAGRPAEAAVAAYRHQGTGFAAALEGQFNIILHDADRSTILIANSRHEHSPLYLWGQHGAFGAATSLGPLGACGLFAPAVDAKSAATFLSYGQLFAGQSLLDGVRVMDQACVVEVDVEAPTIRTARYWDMGHIAPASASLPLRGHVAEIAEALRTAGRLAASRRGRHVVGLSGGLDSRLNLAAVAPHLPDLAAWTFGAPGASDLETAAEICRRLGMRHLTYPIDPAATPRNASDFVATVDGCMTAAFAYQLDRARDLREHADTVLNGYAGEVIVRGVMLDLKEKDWARWARGRMGLGPRAPHPRFERNDSFDDRLCFLQHKYGRLSGLCPVLARPAPPFAELAGAELERLGGAVRAGMLAEAWILENRGRRWTMMGAVSDRHFYADGSVFYDYDFQDRCFATPPRFRRGGRLYAPLLRALDPRLAEIPSGNTGLPVGASRATVVASRLAERIMRGRTARSVSTGASHAAWTRGVLKDHYQSLLEDARTLARPWWDGQALVGRWRAHLAGQVDFSAELGLVAAVELFTRRWVDADQG